jgi:hypothetical protein
MNALDFGFSILSKLGETSFGLITKGNIGKVTVPVTTSLSAIADMGFNYTFKGSKVSIHYTV